MVYMGNMLDFAQSIVRKMEGKNRRYFDDDEFLRLALVHLIQNIGEAARQVTKKTRQDHSSIPWSDIIGMRNIIVHDYIDVDYDAVWTVITEDLPQLVNELRKIVPPDENNFVSP